MEPKTDNPVILVIITAITSLTTYLVAKVRVHKGNDYDWTMREIDRLEKRVARLQEELDGTREQLYKTKVKLREEHDTSERRRRKLLEISRLHGVNVEDFV